jgi:hypothetical protein
MHLAIDGKALRGTGKQTYGEEAPQKQVLHVYYETETYPLIRTLAAR